MVLPTVFNFSNWKPQPAAVVYDDETERTLANISSGSAGETGTGTSSDPFITTYNYGGASSNTSYNTSKNICDGDGGSSSIVWFLANGFGAAGSESSPIPTDLNISLSAFDNTGNRRLGIAIASSSYELENFINNVLNSMDAVNDLINHNIQDPMDGTYVVTDTLGGNIFLSYYLMATEVYIIVFDIDTFGIFPSCGDFSVEFSVQGNYLLGSKSTADITSNTEFIISDTPAPYDFNEFTSYTFDYSPHFKIDRTVEDDLGTTFVCNNFDITFITVDANNSLIQLWSEHMTFDTSYDAINDTYIIKPQNPSILTPGPFSEMLVVLTYETNAGTFVRYQHIRTYNPSGLTNTAVFPMGYYSPNQNPIQFHINIGNGELIEVLDFASGLDNISYLGGGLVSVTFASIATAGTSLPIQYIDTNSSEVKVAYFRSPGNSILACNNASSNAGGQGTIVYTVNLNSGPGIVNFSRQNYEIPDREIVEMPIGTTIYDTGSLKSGYDSVYLMKPNGVTSAKVTIQAPLDNTAWVTTMTCAASAVDILQGETFTFSEQYPESSILVLNSGSIYRPATLGVNYSFVSSLDPDKYNSGTYIANTNIKRVPSKDITLTGTLTPKLIYNDPFSGTPIYHMKFSLTYPGETVVGNDENFPTVGNVRIRRVYLQDSVNRFVVNIPSSLLSSYNISPYKPAIYTPFASGINRINFLGGVEYVHNNIRSSEVFSTSKSINIPMIDIFGYAYTKSYQSSYSTLNPYQGNAGLMTIPKSVGTPSGVYPDISGSNGILYQNFSQPFYHNEIGDKFFAIKPTYVYGDGTIANGCGILSVITTDSVNGDNVSTIGPVVGGWTVPASANNLYARFDGYNTESITMKISGNNSEMFSNRFGVYDIIADLNISQTTSISSSMYVWVVRNILQYGQKAYTVATVNTDYTASYNPVTGTTYTAINPVTVVRLITTPRLY